MKKIYCFCFLYALAGLTSCKKFLSTTPQSFIAPETYYTTSDQLQTALNGVYDVLGQTNGGALYNANLVYYFSAPSDEAYINFSTRVPIQSFLYNATDTYINSFWQGLYSGIERANLLLANIDKPAMDQTQRDLIRGQALFLRAYYYFLLVSYFGDVPLLTTPTASLDNVDIQRTSSVVVYNQILTDMTTAEGLLQTQTVTSLGYGGKVTKTAVEGILARVCLKMAGYPLLDASKYAAAKQWAQKVMNSGEHALNPDYKQIFINYAQDKYDVKESIWEAEFYGNALGAYNETSVLGNLPGIFNTTDLNIGYSGSGMRTTKKLYASYDVDASTGVGLDLRRDWNCNNFVYSGTPGVKTFQTNIWNYIAGKWRREYETYLPKSKNQTPENAVILRYADVLLMLSEAENEINGPTTLAYGAINQVRERAYGSGSRVSTITVTNGGTGYTTVPNVTISGGTGAYAANNGAAALAIISGGKVTAITITSAGAFYNSPPTVTISGTTGSGATATAAIKVIDPTAADLPTGLTKDQFRTFIQSERSRELCFEFLRNQDLIRWGIFIPTIQNMVSYSASNAGPTQIATDYPNISQRNVLFPIPSYELSVNKLLTQNPGY